MDILDYISYDPVSGQFTAIKDRGKIKKGDKLGTKTTNGYLVLGFRNKTQLCHRLAFLFMTGVFPELDVDHINGDRSDNRWTNLRQATRKQNSFNRGENKSKPLPKNIYLHKSGRYRVKMKIEGVTMHFGYFTELDKALEKARSIQELYHKEFAKTL